MQNILQNLKILVQTPDLASKKWVSEQYDSQVMNDTISTGGDAAIVRVHGKNKALVMSSDCTARYVEADPFEGGKQAVAETYRNISAVGGTPLAITNCLNFGNPEKPEIMGQIVRAIKGINEACKALNYPVISGNVSLYNETDGKAIQPTPTIGGVGLLKDIDKRCDSKFKNIGDVVFVIGKTKGHIGSSIFEREILRIDQKNTPPQTDLALERKHSEFVRSLIANGQINACHDVSDGGILLALFEMCSPNLGVDVTLQNIKENNDIDVQNLLFGEDQSRYIISVDPTQVDSLVKNAKDAGIDLFEIAKVKADQITIEGSSLKISELKELNESIFPNKFS
ncbi:MAG: AIR synthase related protein [Proteobacteria bacterium]|nr:AIR synthase related protein [Pseudomonadota bacterium]